MSAVKDMSDLCAAVGPDGVMQAIDNCIRPISVQTEKSKLPENRLPPIVSGRSFMAKPIPKPAEIIKRILYKGSKMVLGGGSKSHKTFLLLNLMLSVAAGQPWLGFETTQARVLYINLELEQHDVYERIENLQVARTIHQDVHDNYDLWHLRGYAEDISALSAEMIARAGNRYGLIIVDPIYKVMGDRVENDAGDMTGLCNEIERLAVKTGAAVVFGAHFSKGNQAGKESMDRISGSGVFARDPDALLIVTPHKEKDVYVVEATLRSFAPVEPFCIRWKHPVMEKDIFYNPKDFKQAKSRERKYTPRMIMEVLGIQSLTHKEWKDQSIQHTGMSPRTFGDLLKEVIDDEDVSLDEKTKRYTALNAV